MSVGPADFLKPAFFDTAAKAALLTARQSIDDEEELVAPSTAIRIGYDIKWMLNIKLALAIRHEDQLAEKEATDLRRLMSIEWPDTVRKCHT